MTNPLLQVFSSRPGTLAILEAEIQRGTPAKDMEARLRESCEQWNDMAMYPALVAGLRELYRMRSKVRGTG